MRRVDDMASCRMAAAIALRLFCREKFSEESSSQTATGLACPLKSQSLNKKVDLKLIFSWSVTLEFTDISTQSLW